MNKLQVRTTFPPAPIGYLILVSGREGQAVAACQQAFEGLSKRNKKKVDYCDLSFATLRQNEYIAMVRIHCESNGKKSSFIAGGAIPFQLGSSDPETCLSAEGVLTSMQYFFSKDAWWELFLRWLFST